MKSSLATFCNKIVTVLTARLEIKKVCQFCPDILFVFYTIPFTNSESFPNTICRFFFVKENQCVFDEEETDIFKPVI
jgi:hypothetical protein